MRREGSTRASHSTPTGGSEAAKPLARGDHPSAVGQVMNVQATLQGRLAALAPTQLEIRDDSAAHVGHAGAAGGAGHFSVTIVSEHFLGMTRLARHRAVLSRVGDLIPFPVHALAIHAYAPGEPVPMKG